MALEGAWPSFRTEWNGALQSRGLTVFHMRDFAHSRRAFASLGESERRSLMADLIASIHRAEVTVFGAVMPMTVWNSMTPGQQRGAVDPYFTCMQECLFAIDIHCTVFEETAHVTIAHHPEYSGKGASLWQAAQLRSRRAGTLETMTSNSPRLEAGLQAADLVAYELQKGVSQILAGGTVLRWPFQQLTRGDKMLKVITEDYVQWAAPDVDTLEG